MGIWSKCRSPITSITLQVKLNKLMYPSWGWRLLSVLIRGLCFFSFSRLGRYVWKCYGYSVIRWYIWRTRQESNLRPSVPQTVLAGIQGQSATNKDNNINKMIAIHCCHISPNMAWFCKLMAQNWHKNFPHI